jgi:citrate synthase
LIDQSIGWLDREAALALLGVKPATLYSYVSRGLVRRIKQGRRSRYHRGDVEILVQRSGARAGHAAVANQALRWGPPVIDSALTRIDAQGIAYRGHPIAALIDTPFESVAELLWTGALPTEPPAWPAGIELPLGDADPPLERLRAAVAILPAPPLGIGASQVAAHARQLAATFVGLMGRRQTGPIAERLFEDPQAARLANRALVACADHGLNASAFTARIVASTGADLHACVIAALAALSGPRHGGTCARIEAILNAPDPAQAAAERLKRGETVPGFGHPLYPKGDPRTPFLMTLARAMNPGSLAPVDALVARMAEAGHPSPTIDLGLVATARALGLPAGSAVALFALGRLAGWTAHVIEQQQTRALLRPRARYVGP